MPLASQALGTFAILVALFGLFLGCIGVTWLLLALHLRLAKANGWGHPVRKQGPEAHLAKEGTPTAAGWTFLPAATALGLSISIWTMIAPVVAAAGIGFADDLAKLRGRKAGVPARWRLLLQIGVGALLALAIYKAGTTPTLWPWLAAASLGWYALFHGLAFAAIVNAVNFTDGADGLLAATLGGAWVGLLAATYFFTPRGLEEAAFAAVVMIPMAGLLVAWWFFNHHPAKMFMGETGSYLLGAWVFVAGMGNPWVLLALATIPLWELLSVVIQVVSFRTTGKRVFKMAPFHHHLELSGWSEKRLAGSAFVAQFAFTFGILWFRSVPEEIFVN